MIIHVTRVGDPEFDGKIVTKRDLTSLKMKLVKNERHQSGTQKFNISV